MLASFSSSSKGTGAGRGRGIEGLARRSVSCYSPGSERSQIWAMRVPRGRRHARRGGMIHGSDDIKHSPANELVTSSRPLRYSPSSTPTTRLSSESSWREGGEGRGEVSHQTGEGTRFRSARRGGARTSSTRRKWSTTERSTRGCTTTSSYCPRGLTTSTLAAIVGGRVPITCGERLRRPRRFDREEKSWKRPRPRKCRRRLRARDSAKRGAHTRGASNDIT